MYEHPSYIYNNYAVEQERIDRENERRRMLIEHPERIVHTGRPVMARVRGWFAGRRADAVAPAAPAKQGPRPEAQARHAAAQ
jgi:hypothetical protein